MASASLKFAVLLVLSAAVPAVLSDSEALAPAADCSNLILSMADCLSFVSNGSTLAKPQGNCCGGLLTVVETNPWCLCEGYRNSAQLGVVLDDAKTKTLPSLCKIPSHIIPNCDAPPPAVGPVEVADGTPSTPVEADATPTLTVTPTPATPAPAPAQGTSAASSLLVLTSSAVSVAAAATASWFLI